VRRMRWAWTCYEDARYVRLATISLGHLYNLRKTRSYLARRQAFTKTKPSAVAIGARCAALPVGRASFIRIDSVHQGEQYGVEAQPHINAVDCMTQWAWVATCEAISEAYLLPVIEALLVVFPFRILGLHADNGSEYTSRLLKNRGKDVDMLDAVTIVVSCRANHRSIEHVDGGFGTLSGCFSSFPPHYAASGRICPRVRMRVRL